MFFLPFEALCSIGLKTIYRIDIILLVITAVNLVIKWSNVEPPRPPPPQGSILGPLLFYYTLTIYAGIPFFHYELFADDTTIASTHDNLANIT